MGTGSIGADGGTVGVGEQLAWQSTPISGELARRSGQHAAAVLGWAGVVLPQVSMFGGRLFPVIAPDVGVHETRRRVGDGPELDGDTLAMWEWPESRAPAPAVRLVGALFVARHGFRRALDDARRWRPFGSAAVLAPAVVVADQVSRWNCALHGVGLAVDDLAELSDVDLVPAEVGRRAPARRRTADRWIEETLYAHALGVGIFDQQPRP